MLEKNNKKIFLVDDDEFLIDMYSIKFKKESYQIDTALSGKQALKKLRENVYDILLLDLLMSGVDGFEVLKVMKEEKLKKGMYVIILSNQSNPEDVEKAKKFDVDGYIVKASAVPSEVLNKVEEIIKK